MSGEVRMSRRTRHTMADPLASFGVNHTLRNRSHEEWRDWPNLPTEITQQIGSRLLRYDVAEYLRLRAACRPWRECTDDPRGGGAVDSRFRPRRWIMLSNCCDGVRRRFLNLTTGACAHIDLPELSGHHVEGSAEGIIVLRDKVSDAIRLLNPLTRAVTDLPAITMALRCVSPTWKEGQSARPSRIVDVGITDETSPATVVLFMRGQVWNIAYAKPADERWSLINEGWNPEPTRILDDSVGYKSVWIVSAMTLQGRVYFATNEGNILTLRLCREPRLVFVIKSQAGGEGNVVSYLAPADDDHRRMLMVRHYYTLGHLSRDEQRRIKRRKNTDLIKLESDHSRRRYDWHLIEVQEVDLAGKRLTQTENIGHRAVFVEGAARISLSAERFPSVASNAVYFGLNSQFSTRCGVRCLGYKGIEPPLELGMENTSTALVGSRYIPCPPLQPRRVPCLLRWPQGRDQRLRSRSKQLLALNFK